MTTQSNPREMLERLRKLESDVQFYSGNEASGYAEIARLKAEIADAAIPTIERLNSELGRKGAKVDDTPALRASLKLLRARYDKARCDDEGVACCIRCNTMFLVNTLDRALNALHPEISDDAA